MKGDDWAKDCQQCGRVFVQGSSLAPALGEVYTCLEGGTHAKYPHVEVCKVWTGKISSREEVAPELVQTKCEPAYLLPEQSSSCNLDFGIGSHFFGSIMAMVV